MRKTFKLWDTKKNDWWQADEFTNGWVLFPNGDVQILGDTEFISHSESKNQARFIVVQSCGWKDVYGVEVFEEDIIIANYRNGDECKSYAQLGLTWDMEMNPCVMGTRLKK